MNPSKDYNFQISKSGATATPSARLVTMRRVARFFLRLPLPSVCQQSSSSSYKNVLTEGLKQTETIGKYLDSGTLLMNPEKPKWSHLTAERSKTTFVPRKNTLCFTFIPYKPLSSFIFPFPRISWRKSSI